MQPYQCNHYGVRLWKHCELVIIIIIRRRRRRRIIRIIIRIIIIIIIRRRRRRRRRRRKPTQTQLWRRVRESNLGHIGGRRVLSPLRQLWTIAWNAMASLVYSRGVIGQYTTFGTLDALKRILVTRASDRPKALGNSMYNMRRSVLIAKNWLFEPYRACSLLVLTRMHQSETLFIVLHENQWEDTLFQGSPELFSPSVKRRALGSRLLWNVNKVIDWLFDGRSHLLWRCYVPFFHFHFLHKLYIANQ